MRLSCLLTSCVFSKVLLPVLLGAVASPVISAEIDFNRDVRPILSNKCFACHGPDEARLQAGLRLDQRDAAITVLESGNTAITPGHPETSELVARITSSDADVRMPPAEFGKPLTREELTVLQQWIREGAPYAIHWAYVRPQRPVPPEPPAGDAAWARNAIDLFVLDRMRQHGLSPSPAADRAALARRVALDLTGLPLTVAEVDEFVQDPATDAYERLVDRLLQKPAYGEHWARQWLDLARYADSAGYADDPPRTIWAYRDWVIKALNSNMPFDQFTIEQLAGDLLPNPTDEQLTATAFHRNTLTNNEGGTQDEEFRNVAVVDRVNTTMAVWMGTTMACAQCHSHKYDPISQEEYFRFFAVFNNTQDADRRDESPVLELFTDEQRQQRTQLAETVARLEAQLAAPSEAVRASQQLWEAQLQQQPNWEPVLPLSIQRSSGLPAEILEDGRIAVTAVAEQDVYSVDLPLTNAAAAAASAATDSVAAIRLETLPDAALPGGGAGLGGGNFVISELKLLLVPEGHVTPLAQFVRVELPGQSRILSLAEVQVFSNAQNVAAEGQATQSSTDYAGPPELAIDGRTEGDYQKKSVTHTAMSDNPWWELDLRGERPIERVVLWNRTDSQQHTRLSGFRLTLLDAERQVIWEQTVQEPPLPSAEFQPSGVRELPVAAALADYQQDNFAPGEVLDGRTEANNGWAVGGSIGEPHALLLVLQTPQPRTADARLRLIVEQKSPYAQHLLGRFRCSVTSDMAAVRRAELSPLLLTIVDTPAADRTAAQQENLAEYYREHVAPELADVRQQLASARQQQQEMKPATSVPILRELAEGRRVTQLQYRGNYLDKGPEVAEGVPAVFATPVAAERLDRLALARWLVHPDNPLTARVLANRLWETLFGRGIVVTSEEFGSQGELPTHPELLDWLATELHHNGWDTQALLKLMVTSATYRQSSKVSAEALAADPDNRWLARGPRVRLSAEMVRDQALFVSGLLSERMYGPPVKPPQPSLGLTAAFGSSTDWQTSEGPDRYRRALYTTWRRSNPYPSMATFDAPNREVCTVRRNRTNTPLQSLVTLNDPVYVEAAQALARSAWQQGPTIPDRVQAAFQRCLLRPPQPHEAEALLALFQDALGQMQAQPENAQRLATEPLGPLPDGLSAADAAAMTVVCNVLLNLDEMFLKR